jgi:hypothetical protein
MAIARPHKLQCFNLLWQVKGVEQEFDGDEEAELASQTE